MYYASFGVISLILHVIINHEYILKKDGSEDLPVKRYRLFLSGVMSYYITDVLWGFLYATRIVPLAYTDTVLYFFTMAVTVLFWTRFVTAYLDARGLFDRFLTYAGWIVLTTEVLCLIINAFIPIFFSFDSTGEYLPGYARYINLAVQVVLFLMASCYTIVRAARSEGKKRIRNKTIGASGVVMSVFIVLQTLYPFLPLYAIGLLVGTCLIHTFVEEGVRLDQAIELSKVQKQVEQEHAEKIKDRKRNITFNRIAESLAANYDMIYYVDTDDSSYVGYTSDESNYGELQIKRSGEDFFIESKANLREAVYLEDWDRISRFFDKDYLRTTLEERKQTSSDYRLVINGTPRYTRVIVRKTGSGEHFIIAIENVDDEVRREQKHRQMLNTEKELARRDELTGTKNKTAYIELEESVQGNIDKGLDYLPFALAVCDINDLKMINDTEGHKAGDEYICAASKMLCDVFVHSPVFRIGGDEFVVFLRGEDYNAREDLIQKLRVKIFENLVQKNGPVIAVGVASFEKDKDERVNDVFQRADEMMYEDKRRLKEQA